MSSELIDVYDEAGRHRGVLDRATAHAEGWWHRVFHLLIIAPRPEGPAAILQRRAHDKVTFPGLFDLSATGHLEAGESPVEGLRELHEELGVEIDASALVSLGVRRMVDHTPEGLNRELCHVHLAVDDRPVTEYAPDRAEVASVAELRIADGVELFAGRRVTVDLMELSRSGQLVRTAVSVDSFVPEPSSTGAGDGSGSGYWATVLGLAQRCAAGEVHLSI
ncbi:MAG: NUDIX domain-containing protein [Acidimicrobiales bacterium]|nr:NUDIX domain-containing protein [Acidimicrobiales bacterium]